MLQSISEKQTVDIGGMTFELFPLEFRTARKLLDICQGLCAVDAEADIITATGMSFFGFLTKNLSSEQENLLIKEFGAKTMVHFSDNDAVRLTTDATLQRVFGGRHELVFEWLDACIKMNFSGVLEKSAAAAKALRAAVAARGA